MSEQLTAEWLSVRKKAIMKALGTCQDRSAADNAEGALSDLLDEIERLQRIESAAKWVRDTHPYDHRRVVGLCDCSLCGLNAALDGGKAGDAKWVNR